MSRPPSEPVERLALSVKEAARAMGISERTLRGLLPTIPHCRLAGRVVLPVHALRIWLSEQASAEKSKVDAITQEVLDSVEPG